MFSTIEDICNTGQAIEKSKNNPCFKRACASMFIEGTTAISSIEEGDSRLFNLGSNQSIFSLAVYWPLFPNPHNLFTYFRFRHHVNNKRPSQGKIGFHRNKELNCRIVYKVDVYQW